MFEQRVVQHVRCVDPDEQCLGPDSQPSFSGFFI